MSQRQRVVRVVSGVQAMNEFMLGFVSALIMVAVLVICVAIGIEAVQGVKAAKQNARYSRDGDGET